MSILRRSGSTCDIVELRFLVCLVMNRLMMIDKIKGERSVSQVKWIRVWIWLTGSYRTLRRLIYKLDTSRHCWYQTNQDSDMGLGIKICYLCCRSCCVSSPTNTAEVSLKIYVSSRHLVLPLTFDMSSSCLGDGALSLHQTYAISALISLPLCFVRITNYPFIKHLF